jgi:hypothetical protein
VHGLPRNDLVVSIGLEAIVSLYIPRFYHVACARANSKREFQVEIICFKFRTYYVGIKT